jgi:Uma2 family endonuclease
MNSSTLLKTLPSIPDPEPGLLEDILPKVELIEDDGEPMESDWHVKQMVLLIDCVDQHFRDRDDFYVGGNMFVYFSEEQARYRDFRGPDFFFVSDTTRNPLRHYWCVWQEGGRTPDAVIELSSPSTIDVDHGEKKRIYEKKLKVGDYFCYDPDTRQLEGWTLASKRYQPLKPNEKGWLWSEELELWLGVWNGKVGRFDDTWLRFFDRDGQLVLSENESVQRLAEKERRLREAADAEVVQLRTRISALEKKGQSSTNGGKKKKK